MATKAIQSGAHLDRQDVALTFGATNAMSAAATYPCGYTAGATDGTYLDLGNTDLEGMSVIFHVEEAITGSGAKAVFKVSVSNNGGSNWEEIAASPSIAAANLTAAKEFAVPIPRGHAQGNLMKAEVVASGTVSGGKVSAYVDCYIGK